MSSKQLVKIGPPKDLKSDLIKLGHDQTNPRRSVKTKNTEAATILGKKKTRYEPPKSAKGRGKWFFGIGAFLGPLGLLAGRSWGMDFPEPPELTVPDEPLAWIPIEDTFWVTLPNWLVEHVSELTTAALVGFATVVALAILHRLIRIEKALGQESSKHEDKDDLFDVIELGIRAETGGASRTGLVRRGDIAESW